MISFFKGHETKDKDEKKKLFKKLLLQWHPDKVGEEKKFVATCVFQLIQDKKEIFMGADEG